MPKARKKPIEPVTIRLKKNDLVEVLSGKEKGKTGKVLKSSGTRTRWWWKR
jgi:hypothetical protein